MLAIGRALMSEPKFLLLDEPSLGLSPRLVKDLFGVLRKITQGGQAVVLVEQNVHQSLRLADRVHVLENGRIVRSGSPSEIEEDKVIQQAYLGLESERPMPVQVDTTVTGGFYNPAARPIAQQQAVAAHSASTPARHGQTGAQAAIVSSGGFYNPYARSVGEKRAPAHGETPSAPRNEKPKDTGGFYNPAARSN
jgi:ABC-type multidrug transport system ATPase subunit